jgi:hypothetical protein
MTLPRPLKGPREGVPDAGWTPVRIRRVRDRVGAPGGIPLLTGAPTTHAASAGFAGGAAFTTT